MSAHRHTVTASPRLPDPRAAVLLAVLALIALVQTVASATAQRLERGIISPGDAAVTGFSGALPPAEVAPGTDPAAATLIDPEGPTLRVIELKRMGAAPVGQLLEVQKYYTAKAVQTGQVFAVALDNAVPPNIYVAATSVYGLPIIAERPDADGRAVRLFSGAPGARFMPGLWGPEEAGGGPGSIWRIDGTNGEVRLLANVTADGKPNGGAALGGLAFHRASNSLLVADRETGLVHRVGLDGQLLGTYDHGVDGRKAQGLDAIPFDPSRRTDITSEIFATGDPATWGLAPPERRVFGLGIQAGRLYYAIAAGLEIWSVGIDNDGSFAADATLELAVPMAEMPGEISKITFDDGGRMLLAERPAPTGALDFTAVSPEASGRVLRYGIVASEPGKPRVWQPAPDEYAIGFPLGYRSGNGGVAVGYDYDAEGNFDRGTCGGFVWSTGEQLRRSADKEIAERLAAMGPEIVDGLQGNRIARVRPQNEPPFETYFIDFDDRLENDRARGHMADVAIWRVCGPVLRGGWMWEGWWLGWTAESWDSSVLPPPGQPPPQSCPTDQQKPGVKCCPPGSTPGEGGTCKPMCPKSAATPAAKKMCSLGFDSSTYDPKEPGKLTCIGGAKPDPAKGILGCVSASPMLSAAVCQAGFEKKQVAGLGTVCWPTKAQQQCAPGEQVSPVDGMCHALCAGNAWPVTQCCAAGSTVSVTGKCCPSGSMADAKTGQCIKDGCPLLQLAKDGTCCPSGSKPNPDTGKCTKIEQGCPLTQMDVNGGCCPKGSAPAKDTGECEKTGDDCPPGQMSASGVCCAAGTNPSPKTGLCTAPVCPPGQASTDGQCCKSGWSPNKTAGGCCPPGQAAAAGGQCKLTSCPPPAKLVGTACCSPADLQPGGACATKACGPGKAIVNGGCCEAALVYKDKSGAGQCCSQPLKDGKCPGGIGGTPGLAQCGTSDPNCCPDGYTMAGKSSCLSSQLTSGGTCCPEGQSPQGAGKSECKPKQSGTTPSGGGTPSGPPGFGQCCTAGTIPAGDGSCCAPDQVTSTGICCPAGQKPNKAGTCGMLSGTPALPECQGTMIDGQCCPSGQATQAGPNQTCCPDGLKPDPRYKSTCVPTSQPPSVAECPKGYELSASGSCCRAGLLTSLGQCCTSGTYPGKEGASCVSSQGVTVPFIPFLPTYRPPMTSGCGFRHVRDPASGTCVPRGPSQVVPVQPVIPVRPIDPVKPILPVQPATPSKGCLPPSKLINGQCCSREAYAAGTCGKADAAKTPSKTDPGQTCKAPAFVIRGTCCPSRDAYGRGECGGKPTVRNTTPKKLDDLKSIRKSEPRSEKATEGRKTEPKIFKPAPKTEHRREKSKESGHKTSTEKPKPSVNKFKRVQTPARGAKDKKR